MSYGYFGSTLNDELNRLANGGTYPARSAYLDRAGAAQKWAAAKSVNLGTVTDLVGVVNYVGYDIPHPLDDMMVIRIGVSDNSEESARAAFRQAAAGCEAMFKTFGEQWTSVAVSAHAPVQAQGQAQPVKKIIKRVITRPQPEQAL